jgi:hypothetical protein
LSNIAWLCLLGGAATIVSHYSRERLSQPLRPAVQVGIGVGLAVAVAMLLPYGLRTLVVASAVLLWVPFGAWEAMRAARHGGPVESPKEFGAGVARAAAATLVACVALAATASWLGAAARPMASLCRAFVRSDAPGYHIPIGLWLYTAIGQSASVPLVAVLLVGVAAAICAAGRIPMAAGLVAGLRRCAAPLAAALVLAYAALAVLTARQEAAATSHLEQTVRHEGRYLAGVVGEEWPK